MRSPSSVAVLLAGGLLLAACGRRTTLRGAGDARVTPVVLSLSNAYLLAAEGGGVALVDAGSPGERDYRALADALAAAGYAWADVRVAVLTHAHVDHAGLAHRLAAEHGVPLVLGAGDVALLRAGGAVELHPIGLEARMIRPFLPDGYPPPDSAAPLAAVPAGDSLDLRPYGLPAWAFAKPGHTPGHLVVVLAGAGDAGAAAFAGDLLRGGSLGGRLAADAPRRHYFHDDVAAAEAHLAGLLARGVETFYLGHGGPVAAADVRAYLLRERG